MQISQVCGVLLPYNQLALLKDRFLTKILFIRVKIRPGKPVSVFSSTKRQQKFNSFPLCHMNKMHPVVTPYTVNRHQVEYQCRWQTGKYYNCPDCNINLPHQHYNIKHDEQKNWVFFLSSRTSLFNVGESCLEIINKLFSSQYNLPCYS